MLLDIRRLTKRFDEQAVFRDVELQMRPGELVALLGESGVGKSTLLNCIAGLEPADGGEVLLRGTSTLGLDDESAARLRREHLGFVFQAFHVLPHLDVAANVGLPLQLLGWSRDRREGPVADVLRAVGLQGLEHRAPRQLSGGQLQRVAIARALVHRPALVLADEPTGNLDPETAGRVMDLLVGVARDSGAGVLMVTHSRAAAARCDRILQLTREGIIDAA